MSNTCAIHKISVRNERCIERRRFEGRDEDHGGMGFQLPA